MQVRDHGLKLRLELRNDDHVGAARQATDHRHPAGVPAHHFNDHDAVMGRSGGVQSIEGLHHDANRGIEADAELGRREVVVDRLRHPNDRIAGIAHRGRNRQRVVAADRHQTIHLTGPKQPDRLIDAAGILEGIGAGGAQDRSPQGKDAANRGSGQLFEVTSALHAGPSVLDPGDLEPALKGATGHAANGGIEAGRVSPTSQNADAHDA